MNPNFHLKVIESFPVEKYSGLSTISRGNKTINDSETTQPAIIFGVKEKKPIKDLPTDQILPSIITVSGPDNRSVDIPTDVIEDDIEWEFEGYCYTSKSSANPVASHKMKHRPVVSGVSIGNITFDQAANRKKVGTLGAFVVDQLDGQIVGITNNHVVTPDVYRLASEQSKNSNYDNNDIIQPAQEYGSGDPGDNIIGKVKRSYPIKRRGNYIDAGLFTLNTDITLKQLGYTGNTELFSFATTEELDDLVVNGNPLFKSSRSTGPVGAPGSSSSCTLMADRVNYSNVRVSGNYFNDLVRYSGNVDPSTGGDSGSMVYGLFAGEWKAVGLHMAGGRSRGVDFGLFCRIDHISDLLKVIPLRYTQDTNTPVKYKPVYSVIEGYSSEFYIQDADGNVHWQLGRTSRDVDDFS